MKIVYQDQLSKATQRAAKARMLQIKAKHGEDAFAMGLHVHNASGAMMAMHAARAPQELMEYVDRMLRDILSDLGAARGVDVDVALAVATELRSITAEAGQELLGDDAEHLAAVEEAAKEAIARAARGELPN